MSSDLFVILSEIPDPRYCRTKLHKLSDILFMTIFSMICGATNWVEIHNICIVQKNFLEDLLCFKNGIPSISTFQRALSTINIKSLNKIIESIALNINNSFKDKHISIDGKTLRGSGEINEKKSPFHTLNMFLTETSTVIRQYLGKDHASEMKMIPKILEGLDLKKSIITIDAAGCYEEVTDSIIKAGADYIIALKENQPIAMKEVLLLFSGIPINDDGTSIYQEITKEHGRIEDRSYISIDLNKYSIESIKKFNNINSVIRVNSVVERNGEQTQFFRYYISSLNIDAKKQGKIIRSHWGIENSLHYVLDVVYYEDRNQTSIKNLATVFSGIRKTVINIIQKEKKKGKTKHQITIEAIAHPEYVLEIMQNAFSKTD